MAWLQAMRRMSSEMGVYPGGVDHTGEGTVRLGVVAMRPAAPTTAHTPVVVFRAMSNRFALEPVGIWRKDRKSVVEKSRPESPSSSATPPRLRILFQLAVDPSTAASVQAMPSGEVWSSPFCPTTA